LKNLIDKGILEKNNKESYFQDLRKRIFHPRNENFENFTNDKKKGWIVMKLNQNRTASRKCH
jgi:hypothetical protein